MGATAFFLGCIPARLLLAYLAYVISRQQLAAFHLLFFLFTFVIGLGFWLIYLKGWRKTGAEVGGQAIWWNHLRPLHGTNYLLYSVLAFQGWKHAWVILLADVIIGVIAELRHLQQKST